jgi:hypothetical protein
MPLECFAREGQLLDVRIAWLDVTRWLVPWSKTRDAREGRAHRGRMWTAMELLGVLATAGTTIETLQMIALAKLTMTRRRSGRRRSERVDAGSHAAGRSRGALREGKAPVRTSGMPTRVA